MFGSQGLDTLGDHPASSSLPGDNPLLSKICMTNYTFSFHELLRQLTQIIYDDIIKHMKNQVHKEGEIKYWEHKVSIPAYFKFDSFLTSRPAISREVHRGEKGHSCSEVEPQDPTASCTGRSGRKTQGLLILIPISVAGLWLGYCGGLIKGHQGTQVLMPATREMLPYLATWTLHRLRRQHTTEINYVAIWEDIGRAHQP